MNLLIFGYGYSSHAFVARYGDIFSQISATTRSADKAKEMKGVTPVLFSEAGEALSAADVVLVSAPPDAESDPVLRLYEEGFETANVSRIVYLSTVGVYGDHKGAWVDEETPCVPVAERSHARLAAEEAWADCAADAGAELDILRLSGIYGPGRNALANLRDGMARRIIKPDQVFNRIHVADIADAIAACIARGEQGQIYNVTDDEPAPPQDVVTYAAQLLGVEPPPERDFFTTEMSPMARSFYGENKRVSNARIKRDLGFEFSYPTYREGLRALLDSDASLRA
jgi:nucleoside-diphosphate-sugar epimerase